MWMLFAVGGLLFLWVSGFMNSSVGVSSTPKEISINLKSDLQIENAESKGIVDCDDSLYVIYTDNNKSSIARADRSEKIYMYNRFHFVETTDFTKAVNSLIHTSNSNDTTYIVLYGNIKDTKITNIEVSYNGKTLPLVPVTSETNDYFITTVEVPASENVKSVDLKLFNNRDEDVTEMFQ